MQPSIHSLTTTVASPQLDSATASIDGLSLVVSTLSTCETRAVALQSWRASLFRYRTNDSHLHCAHKIVRKLMKRTLTLPPPDVMPISGGRVLELYRYIKWDEPSDPNGVDDGPSLSTGPNGCITRVYVPNILGLLLCHTAEALEWKEANIPRPHREEIIVRIIELLLCVGIHPEGGYYSGLDPEDRFAPTSLLHMLASGGCQPDVEDDIPVPLHWVYQQRLILLCVLCGADPELTDTRHGATPLAWACWYGCRQGASAMLRVGADMNAMDYYAGTPRDYALDKGWEDPLMWHNTVDTVQKHPPLPATQDDPPYPGNPFSREAQEWRLELRCRYSSIYSRIHSSAVVIIATMASRACESITGKILPGPALQVVAEELLQTRFEFWRLPRPVVKES